MILRKNVLLNVHLRCGHRIMEKENSFRGQSQGPTRKMDKGVLTEERNPGLPDGQTEELTPQPGQGAYSIFVQQKFLMIVVPQRGSSYLYINKSITLTEP